MRTNLLKYLLAGALGFALASVSPTSAMAQDDDDDDMTADDGADATMDDDDGDGGGATDPEGGGDIEPLILPKEKIVVGDGLLINLSDSAILEPISIVPDIWYGAIDKLQVGAVHSPRAIGGFLFGGSGGLCLNGPDMGGCDTYGGLGLVGRYALMSGKVELAGDAGLVFLSLSDLTLALKAGVVGRYVMDKITVTFNPLLLIGLTDREIAGFTVNGTRLHIPVDVMFALDDKLSVGGQSGIQISDIGDIGNSLGVPLSVGANYSVSDKIDVGGFFSFVRLLGEGGGIDGRTLLFTGRYAL